MKENNKRGEHMTKKDLKETAIFGLIFMFLFPPVLHFAFRVYSFDYKTMFSGSSWFRPSKNELRDRIKVLEFKVFELRKHD